MDVELLLLVKLQLVVAVVLLLQAAVQQKQWTLLELHEDGLGVGGVEAQELPLLHVMYQQLAVASQRHVVAAFVY